MLTVYIGRFQPIHFGHVETIKSALTRSERVLIIVGSSENEISFRNPFTFDERVDLIKGTIRELIPQDRHNDILIEGVADVNNDVKWKDSIVEIIRKHESNPSNVELTGADVRRRVRLRCASRRARSRASGCRNATVSSSVPA